MAAIVVIATTPIVTWWVVGDVSTVAPSFPDPDYAVRPLALPSRFSPFIEIAATLALCGALGFLLHGTARRTMRARWWWFVLLTGAAGVLLGIVARVATARVIGANIGAGIAGMGAVITVIPLYVSAIVLASRWWRSVASSHAAGES